MIPMSLRAFDSIAAKGHRNFRPRIDGVETVTPSVRLVRLGMVRVCLLASKAVFGRCING